MSQSLPSPQKSGAAAASAALARAQLCSSPGPIASVDEVALKQRLKEFNRLVISIPDYLHVHPSLIRDAMDVLVTILGDILAFGGRNPKDESKPVQSPTENSIAMHLNETVACYHDILASRCYAPSVFDTLLHEFVTGVKLRIKAKVLDKKGHSIAQVLPACCKLGFHVKVDDHQKYLVYDGAFPDSPATQEQFLARAGALLQTARNDVMKHVQSTQSDAAKRAAEAEARRERAVSAIDDDRERLRLARGVRLQAALLAEHEAVRQQQQRAGDDLDASAGSQDAVEGGIRRRGATIAGSGAVVPGRRLGGKDAGETDSEEGEE